MNKISVTFKSVLKFFLIVGIVFLCRPNTEAAILKNPFEPQLPPKKPEVSVTVPIQKEPVRPPNLLPRRNPELETKPPVIETPLPQLTISGIVWNSNRPQVIINQQVLDIGSEIQGVKILHIRPTAIDVLFQGRETTIKP